MYFILLVGRLCWRLCPYLSESYKSVVANRPAGVSPVDACADQLVESRQQAKLLEDEMDTTLKDIQNL